MRWKTFYVTVLVAGMVQGCTSGPKVDAPLGDSLAIRKKYAESPVLTAEESMKKMQVEEGFEVKLVAAEPMVNTPIALTFDAKGRMWVVEMQGYMPDTAGIGEEKPTGKIVILEDTNNDGVVDKRKIFLDSLVLPRAVSLVENGILVAEPPRLWYVENNNDTAGKKTLVDSTYAEGGNAEHQSNGLIHGLDNWIYSANCDNRYKKQGDHWLVERTHNRGQWGISQDAYGRLFYNHNSANVLGDYFFPSLGSGNKNQRKVAGFIEKIVGDNRVYPARATTGVNRGYMEGILDSNLRLVNFTAACGPVIYRGNRFGPGYQGNAFVAEPSAYLIKRNILEEKGYIVSGKQAYQGKEFLASTDERFRPVSLYDGPDGALYVVDMYRGIIQHKTYLTEYLKREIKDRALTQPLSCGRIYKIVPTGRPAVKPTDLPTDPTILVNLINDPNGWVQDKAQQLLVEGRYGNNRNVVDHLRELLGAPEHPEVCTRALWTLEGLGVLTPADVLPLFKQSDWHLRMEALSVLPYILTKSNYKEYLPAVQQLLDQKDSLTAPTIAFIANAFKTIDKGTADKLINAVVKAFPNNKYVADAVISDMQGQEEAFAKKWMVANPDTTLAISKQLKKVLTDISNAKNEKNNKALAKLYPRGVNIFKTVCQTCHGPDGNGLQSLAPPLNRSEWVNGDKDKLLSIVLFGLTGPVQVNGKLYKSPEINGDMPGIGNNEAMSNEDIAQLLSFIRNSWGNKADTVQASDVSRIRSKYAGREKTFTMEELNKKK